MLNLYFSYDIIMFIFVLQSHSYITCLFILQYDYVKCFTWCMCLVSKCFGISNMCKVKLQDDCIT